MFLVWEAATKTGESEMTLPRVSICIPAYHAERHLPETLATVRAQTFTDWEAILVEDGSRDGTEAILHAFASTGPQPVRYLRHEVNQRLPATRNTGISAARAEWIALLDSDDLWTPEHLAVCLERATRGDADLIHGGAVLFDSDTGREAGVRAPDARAVAEFPLSLFENRYVIQPSTTLLRRELWARAGGFDPHFHHLEDRDMWLRCARAGGRFAYTGLQTCRYRKHAVSMSAPLAAVVEMAENSAKVFEKHLDWEAIPLAVRRRCTAEAWAAAARLRWRAEPAVARTFFQRACGLHWRAQWWLHGGLCALNSALTRARPPCGNRGL